MPVGDPPVELDERRPGIVGARDRPAVQTERRRPEGTTIGRVQPGSQRSAGKPARVLLLDLVIQLLVVGDEEEQFVARDGTAEGEPELVLAEVRRVGSRCVRGVRREGVILPEVVQRSAQLVGARLRDDVDEPARRAPELRVRTARDDHDFLHRIEIERERRALAAALLAEERVVEVGAVHGNVVVDPALSRDRQLVAVGPLHDRDVGREQGEVDVVAAVVRQAGHRLLRQPRRALDPRRVHDRLGGRDRDARHLHRAQLELQVDGLAQPQRDAGLARFGEADAPDHHVVSSQREQGSDEDAALVGLQGALEPGLRFPQLHRGTHRGRARWIGDDAADDAGGRLGLRDQRPRHRTACQQQRCHHDGNGPVQGSQHGESASWGIVQT